MGARGLSFEGLGNLAQQGQISWRTRAREVGGRGGLTWCYYFLTADCDLDQLLGALIVCFPYRGHVSMFDARLHETLLDELILIA